MKITVTHAELPASVQGMCAWDGQANRYIIMINANMSNEERTETLIHELRHIERGDHFKTGISVQLIEQEIAFFDKLYEEVTNAGNKHNSEKPSTDD